VPMVVPLMVTTVRQAVTVPPMARMVRPMPAVVLRTALPTAVRRTVQVPMRTAPVPTRTGRRTAGVCRGPDSRQPTSSRRLWPSSSPAARWSRWSAVAGSASDGADCAGLPRGPSAHAFCQASITGSGSAHQQWIRLPVAAPLTSSGFAYRQRLRLPAAACQRGASVRRAGAELFCGERAGLPLTVRDAANGEGCRCLRGCRWAAPVLSARVAAVLGHLAGRLRLTGTEGLDVSEDRNEEQDAHRRHDDARVVDDGADA